MLPHILGSGARETVLHEGVLVVHGQSRIAIGWIYDAAYPISESMQYGLSARVQDLFWYQVPCPGALDTLDQGLCNDVTST